VYRPPTGEGDRGGGGLPGSSRVPASSLGARNGTFASCALVQSHLEPFEGRVAFQGGEPGGRRRAVPSSGGQVWDSKPSSLGEIMGTNKTPNSCVFFQCSFCVTDAPCRHRMRNRHLRPNPSSIPLSASICRRFQSLFLRLYPLDFVTPTR